MSPSIRYVAYLTRSMRADLRDRLRVAATVRGITMEETLNQALTYGLQVLEAEHREVEDA